MKKGNAILATLFNVIVFLAAWNVLDVLDALPVGAALALLLGLSALAAILSMVCFLRVFASQLLRALLIVVSVLAFVLTTLGEILMRTLSDGENFVGGLPIVAGSSLHLLMAVVSFTLIFIASTKQTRLPHSSERD